MGQVFPPQHLALLLHELVFLHVLTLPLPARFLELGWSTFRSRTSHVSKQLDMLLLCVDDQARQYYYEVDRPDDSMNNVLEFLHARFEGERNALAML